MIQIQVQPISEYPSKNINDLFELEEKIGVGTYGFNLDIIFLRSVYKSTTKDQFKKIYALKKLDKSKETEGVLQYHLILIKFPITALREISILQRLDHENVIKLHNVICTHEEGQPQETYLVFDYIEHDFLGLINKKISFTPSQIKCIAKQLLEGLKYLHLNKIIHRDLKSANILYSNKGIVKIADFGLARKDINQQKTNRVQTLWYRAPELLLGSKNYSSQIDMWSLGCFLYELYIGKPLFEGDRESRQIQLIYEKCGAPNRDSWSQAQNLPLYSELAPKKNYARTLSKYIKYQKQSIDDSAIDFIDKLLILNPEDRLTVFQALDHDYFKSDPQISIITDMPKIEFECHGSLNRKQQVPVKHIIHHYPQIQQSQQEQIHQQHPIYPLYPQQGKMNPQNKYLQNSSDNIKANLLTHKQEQIQVVNIQSQAIQYQSVQQKRKRSFGSDDKPVEKKLLLNNQTNFQIHAINQEQTQIQNNNNNINVLFPKDKEHKPCTQKTQNYIQISMSQNQDDCFQSSNQRMMISDNKDIVSQPRNSSGLWDSIHSCSQKNIPNQDNYLSIQEMKQIEQNMM